MNYNRFRKEIAFILDILIIMAVSFSLLLFFPQKEGIASHIYMIFFPHLILLMICWAVMQWFFKTYNSLWRYAQSREYLVLVAAGVTGYLLFFILDYVILLNRVFMLFYLSVFSVSLLGMLLMRLCYRQYRLKRSNIKNQTKIPVAIIGAGEAGVKLSEELESNPNSRYHTVCFIDDSVEKIGKRIHNIEVKGPISDLKKLLLRLPVKGIIIAIPYLTAKKRKKIIDVCFALNYHIWILPDTLALIQGKNDNYMWSRVRDIRLEDLLDREPINLDKNEIEKFLRNKVVLVTGGGGSIGSELCRQIAKVQPKQLVVVDIYENNAYEIQQELFQIYGEKLELKIEIASIRDKRRMFQIFKEYRPSIVFHAAAHKHVPLMEECLEEAIYNNVYGTYNVVLAAHRYGADKFVFISTDKAVNPTSIMGASKRFCEMLMQSMKEISKTEFVAVRFGNVLGSNGSVIPLFMKQIAQGGPITITDKRIVRYFMTISEAVWLVLQAGSMANNTEVYVLDMGEPVKIIDLAENLIRLSGYVPYTEIPIIETGLRPGEKLYEELSMNNEELSATINHKIFIVHQSDISQQEIKAKLKILSHAMKTRTEIDIKNAIKQVVPSYKDPVEVNDSKPPYDNIG